VFNADGTFTYTPDEGFTGLDSFVYVVCLPSPFETVCDTAVVYLGVSPSAEDDFYSGGFGEVIAGDASDNDVYPSDAIFANISTPANGTLVFNADGTFTYTPDEGFTGLDSFVYVVCLPLPFETVCDTAVVYLGVSPSAEDDFYSGGFGEVIAGDASDNDVYPSDAIFANISTPANGTLVFNADGTFTYTPDEGFTGLDSFVYVVCLPSPFETVCDTAVVYLGVSPSAEDDFYSGGFGEVIAGDASDNDVYPSDAIFANISTPANGTLVFNADGTFTYTPDEGFTGLDSFVYVVCLPSPFETVCDTAVVYLGVSPSAEDDFYSGGFGEVIAGDASDNDVYPSDAIFANISTPANGTLVFNADGTFTYTPDEGFTGLDSFVYVVCLPSPFETVCDTAVVYLGVSPSAEDDFYSGGFGEVIAGDASDNDVYPSDAIFANISTPANGTLVFNADGTFTYTPDEGFTGLDSFVYVVCLPSPFETVCDTAVVYLGVSPSAEDDFYSGGFGEVIAGDASDNDVYPSDAIFANISTPANGTLVFNADGTFTYTPDEGFTGLDSFVYVVCLPSPFETVCDTAVVYLGVSPSAEDDFYSGGFGEVIAGDASDNDVYPSDAIFANISTPANGTLVFNADGTFTYTPDEGFTGLDSFVYVVCLPSPFETVCDTAVVYLGVSPSAEDDFYSGGFGEVIAGDASDNDVYPSDAIFANISTPANGTLVFNADGTFTYTPDEGFTGLDSFVYVVCLPSPFETVCDTAVVYLGVSPSAEDDFYSGGFGEVIAGDASDNDVYPSDAIFANISTPANGTLVFNADGTFTYTPDEGFTGLDSFVYVVCLPSPFETVCDTAVVYLGVSPSAEDDFYSGGFGEVIAGDASDNDVYPSDAIFANISTPANGTLVFNADGTFTYTPDEGFTGLDSFVYVVCLPSPFETVCDTAVVYLGVSPSAEDDFYSGGFGEVIAGDASDNDVYPSDAIFANISTPANGTLVFNADGTFTYTPDEGFTGLDSFVYVVCLPSPNQTLCDTALVTLVVGPNAVDDQFATTFDMTIIESVVGNDTYPSGSTFENLTEPEFGQLIFNSDGSFVYTPEIGFVGVVNFVYSICLPIPHQFLCDTAIVEIVVRNPCEIQACPEDTILPNTLGMCGALVNLELPQFTDDCDLNQLVLTISNAEGIFVYPGLNTLRTLTIGVNTITFTLTDPILNETLACTYTVTIEDQEPPTFVNCPSLPIIVQAPEGWCESFVNFSAPQATDNCGSVVINKIDTTGLNSGSIFPVGTTQLIFEAVDSNGNRDTCIYNIVVNAKGIISDLECPGDVVLETDMGICGATGTGLGLGNLDYACSSGVGVSYRVEDGMGVWTGEGIEDVSGYVFGLGMHRVTYEVRDRPLLLITEVLQSENGSFVEITNFGPAAYDLTNLVIERLGASASSVTLGSGIVLGPGEVYVQGFSGLSEFSPAGYRIGSYGSNLDGVSLNGYVGQGYVWSGMMSGGSHQRIRMTDTDSSSDWRVAEDCFEQSVGVLNEGLGAVIYDWDGSVVTLQSVAVMVQSCSFEVRVEDREAPLCSRVDRSLYTGEGGEIALGSCLVSEIEVTESFEISKVRVLDLEGMYGDVSGLKVRLISPSGREVVLFENICPMSSDFAISFGDGAEEGLGEVACGPAGQGGEYRPMDRLSSLKGENSLGVWRLEVSTVLDMVGSLLGWVLELESLSAYEQGDVVLENSLGLCGAELSWTHAYFGDNCCEGMISVDYLHLGGGSVPVGGVLSGGGGQEVSAFFAVGETIVTYRLEDVSGNVSTCSFVVEVLDVEDPMIPTGVCRGCKGIFTAWGV
jgi:hypothetical protein